MVHCVDIEMLFEPHDRAMFLDLEAKLHCPEFRGSPRTSVLQRGTLCRKRKFDQYSAITWKRCKTECKLVGY